MWIRERSDSDPFRLCLALRSGSASTIYKIQFRQHSFLGTDPFASNYRGSLITRRHDFRKCICPRRLVQFSQYSHCNKRSIFFGRTVSPCLFFFFDIFSYNLRIIKNVFLFKLYSRHLHRFILYFVSGQLKLWQANHP